ncbi:N-acetyltransferase [Streptomyces inusitatus]|uniref:N-acetyltransferase n=1 Tax=Streptomyces inusitatus TaxID=68221 RepID=A0A918Q5F4_9ACTN|nr:GNAT family N-acetyltransferase [Streptomyces inusitatus]GGZ31340.1 N-acetyltransferase [Streptomyces inusitatus]
MTSPAPGLVRPATPADVPAAVRTLAGAFADYPYTRHVVAADGHEERVRRLQELFLTRIAMPYGRVWVGGEGRAVAVWTTPEKDPTPGFAEVGPLIAELAGDRAAAYEAAEAAVEPHRPQEPVWMLGAVAVAPEAQGRGLGAAVIRPGLAAADLAGQACYLETATGRNVRLYERLGFRTTVELPGVDGGPRVWCMRREPGAEG